MPWQSVQTGAWEFPRATACPWMLCMNSVLMDSWHSAQVRGTLSLKIEDFGSTADRISWEPWQSVQTAALSDPAATALPWTLSWYDKNGCALCPLACITNFSP